jgi:multidrug transporter EmrE-like cation transporter
MTNHDIVRLIERRRRRWSLRVKVEQRERERSRRMMAFFSQPLLVWFSVLAASVAFDVGATAYLKVAADRIEGFGFFWSTVLGAVAFAPSIIAFGYAMKIGPSYIATVGVWAVGVYAANAVVGVLAFGDRFSLRTVAGLIAAGATVVLLKPSE